MTVRNSKVRPGRRKTIRDTEETPATERTRRVVMPPVATPAPRHLRRPIRAWLYPALVMASFSLGLLTSALVWARPAGTPAAESTAAATSSGAEATPTSKVDLAALLGQVNPEEGYRLPVSYGDLGPRLLLSGAIDYQKFVDVYTSGGDLLNAEQIAVLKERSNAPIIITSANAHFLLNFFWAVGLANKNPVLTDGPISQYSEGRIDRFASTGGWTLGKKPVTELFASTDLIQLSPTQQSRLEEVASAVYRPCCDNPTLFPDCNHGMAMLGLLELMASQDASVDQMLTAAKYVNAYWFPQQAIETAIYLQTTEHVSFAEADARSVVGSRFSSGSGARQLHSELQTEGLLPTAPDAGGSCGT